MARYRSAPALETTGRHGKRTSMSARGKSFGKEAVEISSVTFDSHAPELLRSWSSYAAHIYCANIYQNGISLSHQPGYSEEESKTSRRKRSKIEGSYLPNQFHLRVKDTRNYLVPPGNHWLYKDEHCLAAFEKRLAQFHEHGTLGSSVFYFGTITDPFLSFHKKFDLTMTCLELLEHYRPQFVVVQTRSPMVISALPLLKMFGDKVVVCMPIESRLDSAIARYTPEQPKISDRLIAADGLRVQGVHVNLMASPILPYGDPYRDAWAFADLLDKHADFITFGCLTCGKSTNESRLKNLPIARKLVADNNYRWLRPYAYRNLYSALKVLAPKKLLLPVKRSTKGAQLDLFAA